LLKEGKASAFVSYQNTEVLAEKKKKKKKKKKKGKKKL